MMVLPVPLLLIIKEIYFIRILNAGFASFDGDQFEVLIVLVQRKFKPNRNMIRDSLIWASLKNWSFIKRIIPAWSDRYFEDGYIFTPVDNESFCILSSAYCFQSIKIEGILLFLKD
jgi:hypothetical protein